MRSAAKVVSEPQKRHQELSFDIEIGLSNGEKALFTVTAPQERMIAGSRASIQEYQFQLNDKVMSSGNICNTRTTGASYSLRMDLDTSYMGRSDPAGMGFALELKFDAPRKSSIKISPLREVETIGDLSITSRSYPLLSRKIHDGNEQHNSGKQEPKHQELISLDQYLIEARGTVIRKDPQVPLVDFSNTVVGLWKHVPDMVESFVEVASKKISRLAPRSDGILNIMLECVTTDAASRADAALAMVDSPIIPLSFSGDLDRAFSAQTSEPYKVVDELFENLRTELIDLATKLNLKVQFHMVDVNMDMPGYVEADRKWEETHDLGLKTFLKGSQNKETFLEEIRVSVNEELKASQQFNRMREAHVVNQVQEFALGFSENAVNLLIMGAAHAPILRHLPKSHPVVAVWSSEEIEQLPAKARRVLSKPQSISSLSEIQYDKSGQLEVVPALRYVLNEILGHYRIKRMGEITDSPIAHLSARYLSQKLSNSAVMKVFNKVSDVATESSPRIRLRAFEGALLEELCIEKGERNFNDCLNDYVLTQLDRVSEKKSVPRLRSSVRKK